MTATLGAKLALARTVGTISRWRGGGATSAPGRVLMRLQPDAIRTLGSRLERGSALISATNGKTTTASMAAAILRRAGVRLVHNQAGANMAGGVATALLDAAGTRGGITGELGLFEVDELWLAAVADELAPRAVLLSNLFRDQLDRYGELERIAESWEEVLSARPTCPVLNADDPLVADLGRDHPQTLYFGVEDDSLAMPGMSHAADAKHCRRCGAPYVFDAVYLGHLGHYHCDSCGQRRPTPAADRRRGPPARRTDVGVHASLPRRRGPRGARPPRALQRLQRPRGGGAGERARGTDGGDRRRAGRRAPRLRAGGEPHPLPRPTGNGTAPGAGSRELRILLVKNPAGANEVLRTLTLEPGRHDLLGVLNDNIADGRDVSWIWDADFELLAGRIRRITCSGTRAPDLAVRMKYAGVDPAAIHVEPDLPAALEQAAASRPDPDAPLYALPTYTAMLSLRELLVARGEADSSW